MAVPLRLLFYYYSRVQKNLPQNNNEPITLLLLYGVWQISSGILRAAAAEAGSRTKNNTLSGMDLPHLDVEDPGPTYRIQL